MAITITKRKSGKFMVDITYTRVGEQVSRRFRKVPEGVATRGAAESWATTTLAKLVQGEVAARKKVPTLAEFWPDFIERYVKANRQKHSELVSKESRYKHHLEPWLGRKRLDEITNGDVQAIKGRLSGHAPKTVNNVLSVLGKVLKVAVKWKDETGLLSLPCEVDLVKVPKKEMEFYERDVLERLIVAAREVHPQAELVVLLGAEAGLRSGEIVGLQWRDLDFAQGSVVVNRTVYRGKEGPPKGGRSRVVPMTPRLERWLSGARDLFKPQAQVVRSDGGIGFIEPWRLRDWLGRAQRLAGISTGTVANRPDRPGKSRKRQAGKEGKLHVLRHTYGTHLAAAGVNPFEIMDLMGHADIATTMRYVHAVKGARENAAKRLAEYRREQAGSTFEPCSITGRGRLRKAGR